MRRSQPASQDSEDADTVATADCSRWRPVSAPQPWWAMEPCESGRRSSTDGGRRVRARTAPRMNDDASSSSQLPGGSPDGRPTAAERAEALSVIRQMKEAEPPILSRRGAPPKPNVVACAIALYRGEVFESDADALRIFGAAETTMVRRDWVEDKLARFAPAGASILQASRFRATSSIAPKALLLAWILSCHLMSTWRPCVQGSRRHRQRSMAARRQQRRRSIG